MSRNIDEESQKVISEVVEILRSGPVHPTDQLELAELLEKLTQ